MEEAAFGRLVGIEGSHASGKTSLSLRLAAELSSRGRRASWVGDPARNDPFVDDVVIRGSGDFDARLELSLFCRQIADQLHQLRQTEFAVCDKTPMSCAAYTRLLLPASAARESLVEGFRRLSEVAACDYIAVFLLNDRFDGTADPLRSRVLGLEDETYSLIEEEVRLSGVTPVVVGAGLDQEERLAIMLRHLLPATPRA